MSKHLEFEGKRVHDTGREQESWRSHAQVDIDRILYSTEFRRLAGVTQVIPPQPDFQLHDRLAHSVKVAQVAATLARQLLRDSEKEPFKSGESAPTPSEWIDPDYCYLAGLAHDMGHPPFGHAGEVALQQIMDDDEPWTIANPSGEDTDEPSLLKDRSFEGNAQSMRIVATQSFRKSGEDGLNLTYRSLAAIAKYPWQRGQHPQYMDAKLRKKWSFYEGESAILEGLIDKGYVHVEVDNTGEVRRVLRWVEAEIMDWADDISYAVHDIDDFFRAGLIPLDQFQQAFQASSGSTDWLATNFDFSRNSEIRQSFDWLRRRMLDTSKFDEKDGGATLVAAFKMLRELFNEDSAPLGTFTGAKDAHIRLRGFGANVIKYLSSAASLIVDEDTGRIQLRVSAEAILVAEFFKGLNRYFVIDGTALASMQFGQTSDLGSLCDSLFDLAVEWLREKSKGRENKRLPARLREYLAVHTEDSMSMDALFIAIVDYVCGLQDSQAAKLALQLRGSSVEYPFSQRWLDF